ncbi:hypothetical protein C4573_02180 [Candidatus Woesearchaeota archaeon]|nr:MAG: hypothetical protein C4573_02180 [Candidatus Woesearchaeota archaeon]
MTEDKDNSPQITNDRWIELKQIWYQLFELRQIEASDTVKDCSLLMCLGAILNKHFLTFHLKTSRKIEDLRLHLVWMIDSRAGKGEVTGLMHDVCSGFIIIALPTSISDTAQIGGADRKGKEVEGIYKTNDLCIHDEFENFFKNKDWNSDVFGNIRKNCDTYMSATNYLRNTKISTDKIEGFYGKSTLFLSSYPILECIQQIVESGTFQRFVFIFEKVDIAKSKRIFVALKQKPKDEKILTDKLLTEKMASFRQIITAILNESSSISLGDEAYNETVDEFIVETEKHYNSQSEEVARLIRSYQVGLLLQIQKISAIVGIVRGKPVVEAKEIQYAKNLVMENFNRLILETSLFGVEYEKVKQWVDDVRTALKNQVEPLSKMEINKLMGVYWGLKSPNSINDRLKKVVPFTLELCRKEANTEYWRLKSIYGG